MEKVPPTRLPTTRDLQGNVITRADLPSPDTVRWTANKKTILVRAVQHNLVTLEEVLERYHMTQAEFAIWKDGLEKDGAKGVKVTHYQRRRGKKFD